MDGAPQLRQLSLANNHLAQLLPTAAAGSTANPLAACTATLTSLSLANNRLHSLAGIGACTALTSLDVSRNQLTSLAPLSSCTALRQLAATHNAIDAWPQAVLAAMPGLRTLDLSGNAIPCLSTVPPNAAASLNSNNESQLRPQQPPLLLPPCLEVLLLQDNQISSIAPLQGAPGLARLDLSFNRLEGLGQLRAGLAPLGALMALQVSAMARGMLMPGALQAVCFCLCSNCKAVLLVGVGKELSLATCLPACRRTTTRWRFTLDISAPYMRCCQA